MSPLDDGDVKCQSFRFKSSSAGLQPEGKQDPPPPPPAAHPAARLMDERLTFPCSLKEKTTSTSSEMHA